jgi:signal transduction histidine kinase
MDAVADIRRNSQASNAARIEELGGIIRAYSDVTEKLQQSHAQLQQTVQSLRNELSDKNRQLERKKRLAALGEMAAGMAHEIRNPLGGIQLYASMLARDVESMPPSLQLVKKISAGVKLLDGLVSQVLQFTREIVAHPADIELAALVEQCIELAGDRLQERNITCKGSGPAPTVVRADPMLMSQAILNLLLNAVEAIEGSGAIEIRWAALPAPNQFKMVIADTGPGIPPAVLERIFNPFFTTKESGTGLGLAIVHRIVEAHDGTILATNAGSGGAVFEIRI